MNARAPGPAADDLPPGARAGALLLIAIPWLHPWAPGPLPNVVPWLLALAAAAALGWLMSRPPARGAHAADHWARRWGPTVAWAWVLAAGLSSVMGLLQYLGASGGLDGWVYRTPPGMAFANLRQRNQFASLTSIGLAASLYLAGRVGPGRGRRTGLVLGAALLAAGNAASGSRTGLLQLVLLAGLAAGWGQLRQPLPRRLLVAAALAYAAAALLLPRLAGGLIGQVAPAGNAVLRLQAGDALCASRLTLWANVLQLIAQKPWGGWGWGELDYAHFVTRYDGPRFCALLDNAHNLPLHLAVELGVPLAAAVVATVAWGLWRGRPWRERDPARHLAWSVLAVIGLHSLLEYPLWYGPFQIAAALSLTLLWARPARTASPKFGSKTRFTQMAPASAAIFTIAFSGLVLWDYQRVRQIYLPPAARAQAYQTDTLDQALGSWFFRGTARFAALSLTPLTPQTAAWTHRTARALLHDSPEPLVIERLIESARLLGYEDEAQVLQERYRAAYPAPFDAWAARQDRSRDKPLP